MQPDRGINMEPDMLNPAGTQIIVLKEEVIISLSAFYFLQK